MRCISCGTCTYVCPNCYCFNISDELVETRGERYRTWDNCFNPIYTEETSGHNPRAQKSNRFRNRFSHKFWYYPEKYDSLLCSGCGRCIMHCPTRIDIREVLRVMGAQASCGVAWPRRRPASVASSRAAATARPEGGVDGGNRQRDGNGQGKTRLTAADVVAGATHGARGQEGRQLLPARDRHRRRDHPGDAQHQDLPDALRRPGGHDQLLLRARPGGPAGHLRHRRVDLRHHLQPVGEGVHPVLGHAAGEVTKALHKLSEGDKVGIRAPMGCGFPVEDWKGKKILFVMGGIGSAALKATIEYTLEHRADYAGVSILYGATRPAELHLQVRHRGLAEARRH